MVWAGKGRKLTARSESLSQLLVCRANKSEGHPRTSLRTKASTRSDNRHFDFCGNGGRVWRVECVSGKNTRWNERRARCLSKSFFAAHDAWCNNNRNGKKPRSELE